MSTKTNLTLNAANYTSLPIASNQPIKKEVDTVKRSFTILFSGITLGWITCMTILMSYVLQS